MMAEQIYVGSQIVAPERIQSFRSAVRRAGLRIVSSAPVSSGYAVVVAGRRA